MTCQGCGPGPAEDCVFGEWEVTYKSHAVNEILYSDNSFSAPFGLQTSLPSRYGSILCTSLHWSRLPDQVCFDHWHGRLGRSAALRAVVANTRDSLALQASSLFLLQVRGTCEKQRTLSQLESGRWKVRTD